MNLPLKAARTSQPYDRGCFLAELKRAHANLLNAMDEMDRVTRGGAPDKLRYGNARWRLSQASLARRSICNGICASLIGQVTSQDERALRDLQSADRQMLQRSASHVMKWTPDKIEKSWLSYCEASREIRFEMMARIGAETRVLYPLLRRYAGLVGRSAPDGHV